METSTMLSASRLCGALPKALPFAMEKGGGLRLIKNKKTKLMNDGD
jgi:hypothetical protein